MLQLEWRHKHKEFAYSRARVNIKRDSNGGRNLSTTLRIRSSQVKWLWRILKGYKAKASVPSYTLPITQEFARMYFNSVLDERTLREIYLPAFEIAAVEGKPGLLCAPTIRSMEFTLLRTHIYCRRF